MPLTLPISMKDFAMGIFFFLLQIFRVMKKVKKKKRVPFKTFMYVLR